MAEAHRSGQRDPTFGSLAARAIEVLVTHNEPVSRNDLACALGISEARAWAVAHALERLGYARVDDRASAIEATPGASAADDGRDRDEALRALEEQA